MNFLNKLIDKKISERIDEIIDSIVELKPNGSYIIVLPDTMDQEIVDELVQGLDSLSTTANILVIQAGGIKIIDLS